MKHPGDPTPRSARDVLADRSYKMVAAEQAQQLGGYVTNVLVVFHCGTESYWATTYTAVQSSLAMTWQHVEPVVEKRTIYRPVS